MSLNFTIFDAGEAPPEEVLDGPNPAEDPGATNRANGPPVLGNDDGGDVGEENVGNVPDSCLNFSFLFNFILDRGIDVGAGGPGGTEFKW